MSKIREQAKDTLYACPCCGYATIGKPAEYEICEICFWEDDGQDGVSLSEARFNFLVFGAAEQKDLRHCRSPSKTDTNLRNYYLEYRVVSRNKI
ncbi:CPCC family cysteine-rich protein [Vibrio sp. Isolate24]|uniref:CPCC family cysteine-rich protein n=1 Tax=Vibrio sp. Isolate24 TaxID=2908534 RepID=UPI0031F31ECA